MKLNQFIREALVEIAYGVHRAKVEAKDLVAIAPGTLNGQAREDKIYVDFDVAVTVTESREKDKAGKVGTHAEIEVLGVKIGAEFGGNAAAATSHSKETASRITFKVPVLLNSHFRNDSDFHREVEFMQAFSQKRDAS